MGGGGRGGGLKRAPALSITRPHPPKIAPEVFYLPYWKKMEPKLLMHPLEEVFLAALAQATHGKGMRHGGDAIEFLKQPWVHYAKMHGRGFLTGQAAKKLEEAASTREGQPFETEMLGAIVYCAMAILDERRRIAERPAGFGHDR